MHRAKSRDGGSLTGICVVHHGNPKGERALRRALFLGSDRRSIHLDERVPGSSSGGMRPQVVFGLIAVLVASGCVASCWKKSGQAVVLDKEHIAAAEMTPTPAPGAEQSARPNSPLPLQVS
jgi:hypothetical protein